MKMPVQVHYTEEFRDIPADFEAKSKEHGLDFLLSTCNAFRQVGEGTRFGNIPEHLQCWMERRDATGEGYKMIVSLNDNGDLDVLMKLGYPRIITLGINYWGGPKTATVVVEARDAIIEKYNLK